MDKKRLLEMAGNPDFISGIYNYCDRWCERCAFTRRCLTYATVQESSLPEGSEMTDEKVFQSVKESFDLTLDLLDGMVKEQEIDLDKVTQDAERSERDNGRAQAEQNPAAREALEYSNIVRKWFEHHSALFQEKGKKLENEMILGIGDPELAGADILDASEVIHWHQHQIFVKIMRALTGREDEEEMPEVWEEHQRDSDGSAKVALIGIDRSIAAWGRLQNGLEDESGDIAKISEDVSVVNITVVDAKGRIVPTAGDLIRFELAGPAAIIGVGNGDPSSHEPDKYFEGKYQRHLFNGWCQVILQSSRQSGVITLKATAEGLTARETAINALPAQPRAAVE